MCSQTLLCKGMEFHLPVSFPSPLLILLKKCSPKCYSHLFAVASFSQISIISLANSVLGVDLFTPTLSFHIPWMQSIFLDNFSEYVYMRTRNQVIGRNWVKAEDQRLCLHAVKLAQWLQNSKTHLIQADIGVGYVYMLYKMLQCEEVYFFQLCIH